MARFGEQGKTADDKLAQFISQFYADPLGYIMSIFPWTTERSIQMVRLQSPYKDKYDSEYGPDLWACEFLDELGYEIRKRGFNGKDPVDPIRFATSSGHGIGKSVMVAWLNKFIVDTRPWSMGVVTANTSDQLKTKTWAELAKWNALSLTAHWYTYTAARGAMSLYRNGDKSVQAKWRVDALTCKEENAEAFQGLHAANSTAHFHIDEASGVPTAIWEAIEGATTDGEPMLFCWGNPTRKTGRFYDNCIGKFAHRHIVRQIDSRAVSITNKQRIKEWEDDWGSDSDFFKVRVKGEFPSQGNVQFIGTDDVEAAMLREGIHHKEDPLIIGVDVARFGDDSTVIFPRIGNDAKSFKRKIYKGLDTVQVVERVIEMIKSFKALGRSVDGLLIDEGYNPGVIDLLSRLGYNPISVNFGSSSSDPKYRYKVDQMYGNLRDAIKQGLALPQDEVLKQQLVQREYGFTLTGKIRLEKKDDMKDRGLDSPDDADALAITYALNVHKEIEEFSHVTNFCITDFDPFEV